MQRSKHWPRGSLSEAVSQEELASALLYNVHIKLAGEPLNAGQILLQRQQVVAIRAAPQILKLGIVDEHVCRAWSIRTIFQVVYPAVPEQSGPIRIKEDR